MNPPEFTGLDVKEDPENFIEELQNVFQVMHVADTERVELAAYQLKGVARIWFDQWRGAKAEGALAITWAVFEDAFLGQYFPREMRQAKVREFLNLKQGDMSVREYSLKFTQLSRYAPAMVADMANRMDLFVSGLSRVTKREG